MQTLYVFSSDAAAGDFDACLRHARRLAEATLGESMLLSWYDRDRDYESPAGASECHVGCDTPGYMDFAANHGGELVVNFDRGRYVFCFRPLGEFAEVDRR